MAREDLVQARQRIAIEDPDGALRAVPRDANLLPPPPADQLDVARGREQVLIDDSERLAGPCGEDEPLGGHGEKARGAVDVGD